MSDVTVSVVVVPLLLALAIAALEGTRAGCAWLVQKARAMKRDPPHVQRRGAHTFAAIPALD